MKGESYVMNDKRTIKTQNFILVNEISSPNGDSTWVVTENDTKKIFYIHVFNKSCIQIKFFKKNYIHNAPEAIRALCNDIFANTEINPSIAIHKNKALIITCKRAGFKKDPKNKKIYTFTGNPESS